MDMKFKRFLSLAMALAMVVSMIPGTVFATETESSEAEAELITEAASEAAVEEESEAATEAASEATEAESEAATEEGEAADEVEEESQISAVYEAEATYTDNVPSVMGTVTASGLNVRDNPSSDSTVLCQLPQNQRVEILEQVTDSGIIWGRIGAMTLDDGTEITGGWINLAYVQLDESTEAVTEDTAEDAAEDTTEDTEVEDSDTEVETSAVTVNAPTVSGEQMTGSTITVTANVTGGSGFYAFNYWLFDSTGTIVAELTNTFETSWSFTAPAEGVYLVRVYATDFATESYADSAWFYVQGVVSNVDVSDVVVTEADGRFTASATVTGGAGFYAYNYWLFDSTGTIVAELTNTFETSWTFTPPADGIFLVRIYATDFSADDHADSSWFAYADASAGVSVDSVTVTEGEDGFTATAAVSGGSGVYAYNYWLFDSTGTIVAELTNTFETSWTFTPPADGIYLVRVYATDFTSDAHNDSAWFAYAAPAVDVADVTVTGIAMEGEELTISASVTGGNGNYVYSYWLIDSEGNIAAELAQSAQASWTVTAPAAGTYMARVFVSDGSTDDVAEGEWFEIAAAPADDVIALNVPKEVTLEAGGSSVFAFTAPAAGTYYFYSEGTRDTYGYLYADAECTSEIKHDDDAGQNSNFLMSFNMGEGETVYLKVRFYSNSTSGTMTVMASNAAPLYVESMSINTYNAVIGGQNSVTVGTSTTENVVYHYFLEDAEGNVLATVTESVESRWTFDVPETAGRYTVRVQVTNGIQTAENSISFSANEFEISNISCSSVAAGGSTTIYAYTNGSNVTYSFILLDEQGNVVNSLENSDTYYWSITAPETPGEYTVQVYAVCDGVTAENTATLWVGQFFTDMTLSDSSIMLGEEVTTRIYLSSYASSDFVANYWILDENGNVVAENLSSTETSWTYTPTVGGNLTVRVTAAYNGYAMTKEATLNVSTVEPIYLNQPVSVVSASGAYEHYSFTAPADGIYQFYSEGNCDPYLYLSSDANFGGDLGYCDDSSGRNFSLSYVMTAGQTVYLKIGYYGTNIGQTVTYGVRTVDFAIDSIGFSSSNAMVGAENTVYAWTNMTTGTTYSFYLMDSNGNVLASNENAANYAWTFTVPAVSGTYQIRVVATNGTSVAEKTQSFTAKEFQITSISQAQLPTGAETNICAYTNAGSGDVTYSFFLLDAQGQTVDAYSTSESNYWPMTMPATPGEYTVLVYAAYNGFTAERSQYIFAYGTETIGLDQTVTKTFRTTNQRYFFGLAFTAPADGTYYFYSEKDNCDPAARLYADAAYTNEIGYNDDGAGNLNFLISYTMTAGQTVYLKAYSLNSNGSSSRTISVTVSNRLPLKLNNIGMSTWSPMVGAETTVYVHGMASEGTLYSYFIMDSEDNVVNYVSNITESSWTFTAPAEPGRYTIRVMAYDGVESAEIENSFSTTAFQIYEFYSNSPAVGGSAYVYVYTNAGDAEGITYSYFLMDAAGNVLQSNQNTTEDCWQFTAPDAMGNYTVIVYAAYNGYSANETCTLPVGQFLQYVHTDMEYGSVGVPMDIYAEIAGYAYGNFVANYWILDAAGNVVAENLGSTDESWTYTPTADGYFTARVTAAYNGDVMTKECKFRVVPTVTVTLDTPATIYNNSTSGHYSFSFTAPADGTYYFTTSGNGYFYRGNVHTDTYSAVPGTRDIYYSRDMVSGETITVNVYAYGIGNFTINAYAVPPVAISEVYFTYDTDYMIQGQQATVCVDAENAIAYNYYVLDSDGNIVASTEGATETEWTFTVPGNGRYQAMVYATNGVDVATRYSPWRCAYTQVTLTENVTASGYGAAVDFVFTAPNDGVYRFDFVSADGTTLWDYDTEGWYTEELYEGQEYHLTLATPNCEAATVYATVTEYSSNEISLGFEYETTFIGGYPMTISIDGMYDRVTWEELSGVYCYELQKYNMSTETYTLVATSGWTGDEEYTFTLPNDGGYYRVYVYGTPDNVRVATAKTHLFVPCVSSRVVTLTEDVAWNGTINLSSGSAFVFQAQEADDYFVDLPDYECHIYTSGGEDYYDGGNITMYLEQGEWLYITIPYVYTGSTYVSETVMVTRQNTMRYIGYGNVLLGGTEVLFYAGAYVNEYSDSYDWTYELYNASGSLIGTYEPMYGECQWSECLITLPTSGSYFVRAILTCDGQTTYKDTEVFTVQSETTLTYNRTVWGNASTNTVYKFTAPSSGYYRIEMTNGSNWESGVYGWFSVYSNALDWRETLYEDTEKGPGGGCYADIMLTEGEIIYIELDNVSGSYSLKITD